MTKPAAVYVAIDELRPWEQNPRNNASAVDSVADSIRRFGFGAPILAQPSGRVIAGHTRLLAARALDLDRVPVRYLDLDDAEASALALADNKLTELADWDEELLAGVLDELRAADVDLDGLGWSEGELESMLAELDGEPVEEGDLPEVPEEASSQAGEVYELGPHRLICGDCRDSGVVARLLDGAEVNVAFTSPPYASQRKYDESSGFRPIPPDEYVEWFEAVQANVREHLAEDGSWFVNITEGSVGGARLTYVKRLLLAHTDRWGWRWIDEFAWLRPGLPMDPNRTRRFKNGWESVYHLAGVRHKFRPDAVRHHSEHTFKAAAQKRAGKVISESAQGACEHGITSPVGYHPGLAYPSNVLDRMASELGLGHPAAFPPGLPSFFIRAFSDPGDVIYDPFLGSGTTLIAAAQEGRVAYGCEISPGYCDVIRRRWTRWAIANGKDPGSGALDG